MRIAEEEGIFVSYQDLAIPGYPLFGSYQYDPERNLPIILLDNSLKHNHILYRCVMAEELGHYFTIPQGNFLLPYTSYSRAIILGRDERRAIKWACNFLLPVIAFKKAISSGLTTIEELAEYFSVTACLVNWRIEFARNDCLLKYHEKRNEAVVWLGQRVKLLTAAFLKMESMRG